MSLTDSFTEVKEKKYLSDICADCLLLTLKLRSADDFGDAETLRKRILELLDDIEREARRQGYTMQDIQLAKFALVAFLDESLIASHSEGKDAWLSNPLQMQLYSRFDAGDEFYNKLNSMLDEIQLNTDVLEVYYLGLTLGFKGKYAFLEQEKLWVITDDVHFELNFSNKNSPKSLSPHGKPKEELTEVIQSEVPLWVIGVGTTAFGLIIYLVFSIFGIHTANTVLSELRSLL